jgi:WD40 repeat protein
LLVSADRDGTIGLWDAATGREVRHWKANPLWTLTAAFSPDGKTIASGGAWQSDIRLWETATGREVRPLGGHHGMIDSVAFLPGSHALVTHGRDMQVLRWDLATGEERVYFPGLDRPGLGWPRTALSPDGRLLATGDRLMKKEDHPVRLWDVATGRELRTLGKHQNRIWQILFSPDGKRLATGSDDNTVAVWDVATGKELYRLDGHRQGIQALAFAPDGNTLASASGDSTVRVWDLTTGKERYQRQSLPGDGAFVFSPDGKLLALSTGYQHTPVRVWEAATGKDLLSLGADRVGTYGLAFTPDSRFLATGGTEADAPIWLWEVASGQEVRRFGGHHGGVFALAFTADGRRLASGGGDSTVLLWDVRSQPEDRQRKVRLAPDELEARWTALAGEDAAKAYQGICDLVAVPEAAVPFLDGRLQPPSSKADPRQVERWITELDSAQFAVRQRAAQALEHLGEAVEPALRKAVAGRPTLEARRRLEQLIERQEKRSRLETLRWLRAMVVLEAIATPGAQRLLGRMAQGGWTTRVSDEAKASLARLAKPAAARP